ncbi:MAG: TonB-dependent receptor family protein [Bacteroidota bacterium]|nr:TonB-dependent receptor family protein [Bacteroidota bacterium]
MARVLLFLFVFIIAPVFLIAQQTRLIVGTVTDSAGVPLHDAYVKLIAAKDSITTTTNALGAYSFSNVRSSAFTISATMIGYQTNERLYTVAKNLNPFTIDPIQLTPQHNRLADVVVVALNPVTVKEDTIEYKANAYKVREGAPVEDVIKKLPGVTVDKDGNVTAQGKAVARVRVNGKDYFGGDVQTATKNLPADVIESIQIIDDYGDRANITGIKEGEPEKILNITIQKNKNKGSFGNGTAGIGTQNRYVARISANSFSDDRQFSLLGSLNNTNANIFNFNGGGRGGAARGANFGSADRTIGGDGITFVKSLGLNFRDKIGTKITTYGSYSFSGSSTYVTGTSFQQDFNPKNISTTARSSTNNSGNSSHRITWNVEYNMDTTNYFKITPYFSYSLSNYDSKSLSETSKQKFYTLNNSVSSGSSSSPSGGSEFLFNHKFDKKGRNFSVNGSIDYSQRSQDRNANNNYHDVDSTMPNYVVSDSNRIQYIANENRNVTTNLRIGYSEPLSKFTSVEFSYNRNNSATNSIKNVDDINPVLGIKARNLPQSNDYDYQFTTQRYGLSLRTFKPKYNYVFGVVAQPSALTGNDIGRKISTANRNFYLLPTARFVYNFARSNNLTITYGGGSREPNFIQLQPISDSTNIRNIVIGNPNLKAEFTNRLSLQYNKVGILTGNSFFANVSYDQTQNKIVSARFNNPFGTSRTTTYLNTDGFYGFNGNFAYTKPFADRKFTATVSTSGSFDNNISYTDNFRNNGRNWVVRPAVRFRLDLPDKIDIDVNANYNLNKTTTNYIDTIIATEVKSLTLGINGKSYFFKDWTLGYDLSKMINQGYLNTKNSNPTILNMFAERRFLKNNKATIRLQAFDLFNQNTGISRDVNGTTVTDVQNNRLGRYLLLTFNLRLQKFSPKAMQQRNKQAGNPGGNADAHNH